MKTPQQRIHTPNLDYVFFIHRRINRFCALINVDKKYFLLVVEELVTEF